MKSKFISIQNCLNAPPAQASCKAPRQTQKPATTLRPRCGRPAHNPPATADAAETPSAAQTAAASAAVGGSAAGDVAGDDAAQSSERPKQLPAQPAGDSPNAQPLRAAADALTAAGTPRARPMGALRSLTPTPPTNVVAETADPPAPAARFQAVQQQLADAAAQQNDLEQPLPLLYRPSTASERQRPPLAAPPQTHATSSQTHLQASVSDSDGDAYDDDEDHKVVETDPTGRFERFTVCLGKGAYKEVFKAFDQENGVEVAWNQLRVDHLSKRDVQRVLFEIQLLQELRNENIINFYHSWIVRSPNGKDRIYFITELMTSGTLKSYIRKTKGQIKPKILRNWARQILAGLQYLHTRDPPIIHRDLKSENIFINGNNGQAKLGDLGLAAVKRREHLSSVLGTPEFMAPELYDEKYDEKVDIYAFGMVLLEIVTKEYPYSECTNQAQIYKKVSSGVKPAALYRIADEETRKFVELCIEFDPTKRPSASDLLKHPFIVSSLVQSGSTGSFDALNDLAAISGSSISIHTESPHTTLTSQQHLIPIHHASFSQAPVRTDTGVTSLSTHANSSPDPSAAQQSGSISFDARSSPKSFSHGASFTSQAGSLLPPHPSSTAPTHATINATQMSDPSLSNSTLQLSSSPPIPASSQPHFHQQLPVSNMQHPQEFRLLKRSSQSQTSPQIVDSNAHPANLDPQHHTFLVMERDNVSTNAQAPANQSQQQPQVPAATWTCQVEMSDPSDPNLVHLKMTSRRGQVVQDIKFPFNLAEDTATDVVAEMVRENLLQAEDEQMVRRRIEEAVRSVLIRRRSVDSMRSSRTGSGNGSVSEQSQTAASANAQQPADSDSSPTAPALITPADTPPHSTTPSNAKTSQDSDRNQQSMRTNSASSDANSSQMTSNNAYPTTIVAGARLHASQTFSSGSSTTSSQHSPSPTLQQASIDIVSESSSEQPATSTAASSPVKRSSVSQSMRPELVQEHLPPHPPPQTTTSIGSVPASGCTSRNSPQTSPPIDSLTSVPNVTEGANAQPASPMSLPAPMTVSAQQHRVDRSPSGVAAYNMNNAWSPNTMRPIMSGIPSALQLPPSSFHPESHNAALHDSMMERRASESVVPQMQPLQTQLPLDASARHNTAPTATTFSSTQSSLSLMQATASGAAWQTSSSRSSSVSASSMTANADTSIADRLRQMQESNISSFGNLNANGGSSITLQTMGSAPGGALTMHEMMMRTSQSTSANVGGNFNSIPQQRPIGTSPTGIVSPTASSGPLSASSTNSFAQIPPPPASQRTIAVGFDGLQRPMMPIPLSISATLSNASVASSNGGASSVVAPAHPQTVSQMHLINLQNAAGTHERTQSTTSSVSSFQSGSLSHASPVPPATTSPVSSATITPSSAATISSMQMHILSSMSAQAPASAQQLSQPPTPQSMTNVAPSSTAALVTMTVSGSSSSPPSVSTPASSSPTPPSASPTMPTTSAHPHQQ